MKKSDNELAFHIYRNQARSFQMDSSLCLFFGLNGKTQIQCRDCYKTLLTGGMLTVSPFEIYGLDCLSDASVVLMRIPASVRQTAGKPRRAHMNYIYRIPPSHIQTMPNCGNSTRRHFWNTSKTCVTATLRQKVLRYRRRVCFYNAVAGTRLDKTRRHRSGLDRFCHMWKNIGRKT